MTDAELDHVTLMVGFGLAWGVLHYAITVERFGVLGRRLLGGVWLAGTAGAGLLACGRDPLRYGVEGMDLMRTLVALGGLALVCVPVVVRAAKTPEVQRLQPEIRTPIVSLGTVWASAAAWGVFLAGYEYVFRGALLWFLVATAGVPVALATTSVLYMLVHLPKPAPGETFASLAMGFVFGAAALWTESFVVAWLLHWAIAVATENAAGRASTTIAWAAVRRRG